MEAKDKGNPLSSKFDCINLLSLGYFLREDHIGISQAPLGSGSVLLK